MVVLPNEAALAARMHPEVAGLRWPLLTLAILGVGAVQVVLVLIMRLLTLVEDGKVFSPATSGCIRAARAASFGRTTTWARSSPASMKKIRTRSPSMTREFTSTSDGYRETI